MLSLNKISKATIAKLFYQIVLIEIFLGGSGQLFNVYNGLSLRMLLFSFMPIVYIITHGYNFQKKIVMVCYIFTLLLALGIALSYLNHGGIFLFEDIKPLLYFYTILYFYEVVSTREYVDIYIKLLIRCSLLVSVIYLIYLSLVKTDIIPFPIVHEMLFSQTDIMFRGNEGEFYFKGFIFLPIALSFVVLRKGLFNFSVLLLLTAIFFSQTRALYLLAFIIILIYVIYYKKYKLLIAMGLIAIIFVANISVDLSDSFENRQEGDMIRITTIEQVSERITPLSIIFGHGLGYGVPVKQLHMEMAYLEIFHKQGILGLFFWFLYFIYSLLAYLNASSERRWYLFPFIVSIAIIYIQSFFNPYIINSMGMCVMFISTTVLLRFNKHE